MGAHARGVAVAPAGLLRLMVWAALCMAASGTRAQQALQPPLPASSASSPAATPAVVGGGPAPAAGQLWRGQIISSRSGRVIDYAVYMTQPAAGPLRKLVYLLHGAGGGVDSWLRDGHLAAPLADSLRAFGRQPLALVMPSVGPHSWWVDGGSVAAATALADELMPAVEARLGAGATTRRALAGVSMGGYGALHLMLAQPGRLCATALIAPAVYEPLPPLSSAARSSAQFARDGGFDGERWQQLSPQRRLRAYAHQQQRVPVWILAGTEDALGIATASARLAQRLADIDRQEVELRLVPGGHDQATFDRAWPLALEFLGRRCGTDGGADPMPPQER